MNELEIGENSEKVHDFDLNANLALLHKKLPKVITVACIISENTYLNITIKK